MAVVFISPKQRQKMFITGITIVVGLFLVIIAFVIFFSQPKEVPSALVFNKPKVTIDFKVFNSDEFKTLQPVREMELQFSYSASRDGEEKEGFIAAVSMEEAEQKLEDLGYTVKALKEAEIGRENPFESYNITTETNLQQFLEQQQIEE